MGKPLRVLMVEDSEDDVLLTVRALKKGGYDPVFARVEDAGAMRKALQKKTWDIILCDYQMPQFNSLAAIALLKEAGIDIPLIIVSGAIGEETAVECMRLGARDYVMKDKLSRLVPSIERELKEAESRSKRRQAEKALRENEDRFRRVSSMISDVAYSCSMKEDGLFSIDWMEGGAERISGYSIEEIKAQKCWRFLVIDEDLTLFDENVTGLSPGLYASCELRIQHKSGAIAWVESYAECVRMETPESFVLYGALVDITDRKRAEETLKGSEEKYRSLFENANEAIFVVQDGKLVFLNPMTAMLTGYSAEELMSRPFVEFIHPDDRDMVIDRHVMRLKGEEIPHLYSFQIIHKDGNVRWVELNAILIHWAGKLSTLNFLSDITELRQLRAVMEENALKYRVLFENQLNGLAYCKIVVNENNQPVDYIFLEINNAFEEHTGLKKKDVLGRRITEIIPGFEKSTFDFIGVHGRVALTGEAVKFEQYQEGLQRWYSVFAYSPKEGYFVSIFSDITERKRMEDTLRKSEANYRQLFDNSPAGIYQVNFRTGKFVRANDLSCEYLGCSQEEITSISPYDFMTKESQKLFIERLNKMAIGDKVSEDPEYEIVNKKGERRWLKLNVKNIYDSEGIAGADVVAHDITEKKRVEYELSESEKHYRMLFNAIDEGFCIIEVIFDKNEKPIDYRFLEINPSFEKQTGLIDAQGKRMRDLAPKHEEHWFEIYGKIALTGQPTRFVNRAEQLHRWYDVYAFRFGQPENRQVAILFNDINERKQAEEALRESETRFKEMFDDAPIGYHELDTEGRITLVNRTELMALCYSAEEMIGHYVWEFVDDKDFSRKAVLNKLAGTSSPGQNLERTYCMKDGTRIPVLIQDRLLRNKDGKITGIRTTVQDISERKRAEETLRESEAKYRILVQESPDAIAVYVGGKIVFANNASIRLMQATKEEELLGRSIIEFVHPDSREFVAKRMIQAQKEGKPLPLAEEKFIRFDGTALTAEVKAMPITINLKPAIQLIIRDITERKRMEETAREIANEREKLIKDLQYALDNIKTLQGLIPICANCKKIRDDKGYWNQVEGYIMKHTGATFTHGCCPECMEKLYGYRNMKK
jgi:PAS domain S-box-containing protein